MSPPESLNEYINKARFLKQIRKDAEALEIAHQAFLAFPKSRQTMELFITFGLNKGDYVISESFAYDLHVCFDEYLRSDLPNKVITQHTIDINASPEELLKQISNILPSSESITSHLDLINDRRLPLFFYKHVLGRNMMLVHNIIISQNKGKIWCFDGSFNVNVIHKSACIYVDLCSLLTLDTLDLLGTLPEVFSDILVPQSVFNELRNFEYEIPPSNEVGFLSKDTSGHVSFSKDEIPYNNILKKAKRIIAFLTTTKNIKICGKPLKTVNKLPVEIIKLLQLREFDFDLDVIQYGYAANCPIMLENLLFRQLFNSINNSPQAFCVIDYLGFLLTENKIGIEKYSQSLAILSKQNYVCLPFTHHVLIHLIQKNGYIIDSHITHIFDSLFSENYNERYVYLYVTSTIILLWNMLIPSDLKHKWTNYLFEKFIDFNHLSSFNFDVTGISISDLIYNIPSRKDFMQYFADFIARYPRISEQKGIKNDVV
jgi:hypothetical protein